MPSKISPDLAAYLDSFPSATRKVLDKIRATVRKAVPDAEEMRSYGVGAFKRGGTYVLYYAGYPKHVSIYPVYAGDPVLGDALKPYTSGKATAKFPLDKPVPYDLITKIVRAKVKESLERAAAKASKRKPGKALAHEAERPNQAKVAEHNERVEKRAATGKGPVRAKARAALKTALAKKPAKAPAKKVVKKAVKKVAKKAAKKA